MIIKDESNLDFVPFFVQQIIYIKCGLKFEQYAKGTNEIEISNKHFNLRDNLVKQLWALKGDNIIANGIQSKYDLHTLTLHILHLFVSIQF
jgi:hypothetical protein